MFRGAYVVISRRKSFGYGFNRYGFTLLVILALIGIAMPALACDAGWYDKGWAHRKAITIDRTKVVSDQKDFPVLINLGSDTDLAAHAQSTGNDLIFTLADGTTKLPVKVESFTSSNGALVAWVKVPVLSSSANTVLFMYYGNKEVSNRQDAQGSWTDVYKGNWRKKDIISWVQTEFNNNNNPSSFYSTGAAEAQPQVVAPAPSPTPTLTPEPTPAPAADSAPTQTQTWNDCGWSYRRAITIDRTKVAADQTDFPVLISLASDPGLAAHAQSAGNDILFTLSDEKTKIPHKIESYVSTTGALVAWVKVPALSSSVNTVLYMYYGNPTAPAQQDTSTIWSYRYKGVWNRKAITSWVQTKYNNQMNPLTFLTIGPEAFQPQACTPTILPTATPTQAPAIMADTAGTPAPADPVPTETPAPAPVISDPTPTPTQVIVDPTPIPTPPFSCPADSYRLVTPDGEASGCVAVSNDWIYNETTNSVPDTLSVTFTMADSYCLKSADVAVWPSSAPVTPQYSQVFDSCTKSPGFRIELPENWDDVAYLYVTAHGIVQKVTEGGSSADADAMVPENPIEYVIQY